MLVRSTSYKIEKTNGQCLSTNSLGTGTVVLSPPRINLKGIQSDINELNQEIVSAVENVKLQTVQFINGVRLRLIERLNKDFLTGKPIRPFYDEVLHAAEAVEEISDVDGYDELPKKKKNIENWVSNNSTWTA